MSGLRSNLALAFGGLLALLLLVGLTSILLLHRYSSALETIFRENYDTVLYAQNVKDGLDTLDELAERSLWNQPVDAAARAAAEERVEENIRKELGNITLPGELEAARRLEQQWTGYRADFDRFFGAGGVGIDDRRSFYRDVLFAQAQAVRGTAQHIIDMNLANMVSADGRARGEAVGARRAMLVLMAVGVVLAVVFSGVLSRAVLRPVQSLTASVREVERGNLDLRVPVSSRDELGELAEAFNAMAARLREFRASDQARLLRTQRTTQLAVDSFPDAVAVVGPDGRVELANEAAGRFFGLKPGTATSEMDDGNIARILAETVATRRPFEPKAWEATIERFDEGRRHFQPRAVPIVAEDGSLVGVTLVLSDVTNLRRLDERKSALVSTVSHELKTPLTSIRMATHLLLERQVGPLTAAQLQLLTAAREDADRLHSIIDDLLDMARLESGGGRMELERVAAPDLLEVAFAEREAAFRDKGVELVVEGAPAGTIVLADNRRLRHVFTNLLDNALRHTSAGGRVVLATRRQGDLLEFRVTDTGSGIAARHLPRLFERFYRLDSPAEQAGAGLGLAIVKEIVEAHGGAVRVESREGQGSTFAFTLRLASDSTGSGA